MACSSKANSAQRCEDVGQDDPKRAPCGEGPAAVPPLEQGLPGSLLAEARPQGVRMCVCHVALFCWV